MFTRSLINRPLLGLRSFVSTSKLYNTASFAKPVTGVTIGDRFNVENFLQKYGKTFVKLPHSDIIYGNVKLSSTVFEACSVTDKLANGKCPEEIKEMFVIPRYGSVCLFDVQEDNMQLLTPMIAELEQFVEGDRNVVETEELSYKFVEPAKDTIVVPSHENKVQDDTLLLSIKMNPLKVKSTITRAICRSTKLSVLENELDKHISKTKDLIYELRHRGTLKGKTETEIVKYCGELYLIRGKLNLYNELIDNSPDVYWSEPLPDLENLYFQISKKLDVVIRINTLNKKLDFATDEMKALLSVLNEKKGTKLEWIIIWLITIEVVIELYHNYERYFM
ncbi:hypothetical protein ACO0QE_000479 [Hanseniaspora vineae]